MIIITRLLPENVHVLLDEEIITAFINYLGPSQWNNCSTDQRKLVL